MDLIERYVYAVTRQLAANQRPEVAKELNSLIHDMLFQQAGDKDPSQEDVEKVLKELGNPAAMAEKYRGTPRYLIGPRYFDTYFFLLRIIVAAVSLGLTVAITIEFIVNPPPHIFAALVRYVTTVLGGAARVFASITIVFAIFEYFGVDIGELPEQELNPTDLPPVPVKSSRIGPVEPIIAILFAVVGIVILNTASHLIAIYYSDPSSGLTIISLFHPEVLATYLPYFNVLLIVAVVKECLKLLTGEWTLPLSVVNFIHNGASLAVFIVVFSDMNLWNDAFLAFVLDTGVVATATALETALNTFTRGLMGVVACALLLDTIISLVKAVRHKVTG